METHIIRVISYYLTDGIYPKFAFFYPTNRLPLDQKDALFTRRQELIRKDIEGVSRVLQARFSIIQTLMCGIQNLMSEIIFGMSHSSQYNC